MNDYADEIKRGERFNFGGNWLSYPKALGGKRAWRNIEEIRSDIYYKRQHIH